MIVDVFLINPFHFVDKREKNRQRRDGHDHRRGSGRQGAVYELNDQPDHPGESGGAQNKGYCQQNTGKTRVLLLGRGALGLPPLQVRSKLVQPLLTVRPLSAGLLDERDRIQFTERRLISLDGVQPHGALGGPIGLREPFRIRRIDLRDVPAGFTGRELCSNLDIHFPPAHGAG